MDNFRIVLKRRLGAAVAYNVLVLLVIVLGRVLGNYLALNGLSLCFATGFLIGLQLVMLYFMHKYHTAIQDEDKLKKVYIEENDERGQYIASRIGGTGINLVIAGLSLAMLIACFIDRTVFFSLLGALFFSVLVKGALKLYYNRKV